MGQMIRASRGVKSAILVLLGSVALTGCAMKSAAGPSARAVHNSGGQNVANADIQLVTITDDIARVIASHNRPKSFSEILGDVPPVGTVIGKGDVLDINIWEAPPAALFGAPGADIRGAMSPSARGTSVPEQMVDQDGAISVPFVGRITVAGSTNDQVARLIATRLKGKAHQPEAIVRVVRNASATVTVIGDVARNDRVPLTAKGERLLDVLASSGGVRTPLGKTMIQITRENAIATMALETVIKDPVQNIRLQPDDIVTALFQPFTFIALGATGSNSEVPFEATGITLAQALGRVGGLQDHRADVRGAFLFRYEDPAVLTNIVSPNARLTPDGKVPVVYKIDLSDPTIFFVAQTFPVLNRDVIYVTNAPLADIQKFVNIVSSLVFPLVSVANVVGTN